MGKSVYKEGESSYLLEYEQKRIRDCARTLNNLADAFAQNTKLTDEALQDNLQNDLQDRKNLILRNRMRETRSFMADHLKEVARIVTKATMEEVELIRVSGKREKQMARILYTEGLLLEELYLVKKEGGKKEVIARLSQAEQIIPGKINNVEEIAEYLSVLLDMRLQPSLKGAFFVTENPDNYYFEEEAKYMILSGFAKAVRETENISGDNYSFLETSEKEFICILSDGMGSGPKAFEDSAEVIERMEQFIESGFHKQKAIQMINDTLLMEEEERNMSTLDLCSIDLYTGKAVFYKAGAALTLIKRDGYVEKLETESLPLGIFHEIEIDKKEIRLLEGDYVIMFSDGMLEYYEDEEGEQVLLEIIENMPYQNPSQIASYLMKHTITRGKGRISDDMTVLVMGFWKSR